jgi:hypothetical protein
MLRCSIGPCGVWMIVGGMGADVASAPRRLQWVHLLREFAGATMAGCGCQQNPLFCFFRRGVEGNRPSILVDLPRIGARAGRIG